MRDIDLNKFNTRLKKITAYVADAVFGLFLFFVFLFMPGYLGAVGVTDPPVAFWWIVIAIFVWIVKVAYFKKKD